MAQSIHTEDQYDSALSRVYELMQKDIKENSAEFAELEVLSLLIENYEKEHFPIPQKH
jgi:HTH-type transcriptional regulator/antitoxin HigA